MHDVLIQAISAVILKEHVPEPMDTALVCLGLLCFGLRSNNPRLGALHPAILGKARSSAMHRVSEAPKSSANQFRKFSHSMSYSV